MRDDPNTDRTPFAVGCFVLVVAAIGAVAVAAIGLWLAVA